MTNVPRDFDIFSPFTVRWPWTGMRSGRFSPVAQSIAGQKTAWKRRMSFPMKCSRRAARPSSARYRRSKSAGESRPSAGASSLK